MELEKNKDGKVILFTFGNTRIGRWDDMNCFVERYEEYESFINEKGKKRRTEVVKGWRFKGYAGTIRGGLELIHRKELLVDENAHTDLLGYLEAMQASEERLSEAVEEIKHVEKEVMSAVKELLKAEKVGK